MKHILIKKTFGFIILFALTSIHLFGQNNELVFEKIQGLSNPQTLNIMQDKQGFLWVCTWGGLNRYDGYGFKTYSSVSSDSTTISSNGVRQIIEDNKGRLWIACNTGLSIYNREKDQFVRIHYEPNNNYSLVGNDLQCMYLDSKGTLWIGTFYHGLNSLDVNNQIDYTKEKPRFKSYRHDDKDRNSINSNYIRSICEDRQSNIWINAGANIIDLYNKKLDNFNHITLNIPDIEKKTDFVSLQFQDSDSLYWFATRGDGIFSWDRNKNVFKQYVFHAGENSLSSDQVRHIRKDKNGIFWICTDGGGISIFNKNTGHFEFTKYDISNPNSLGSDAAYFTFQDNSNITWVATYNDGLNKYNEMKTKFRLYRPNSNDKNSLNHKSILALIEDKNGDLWIGTDGGGLNFLNMKTHKFKYYLNEPGNKNSLSSNAVLCLAEDFEGNIWVGTYAGGLNMLNRKTNKFTCYAYNPADIQSISHNDLWSITEDSNHNLWIGTIAGTLNLFDRKSNKFYRFRKDADDPNSFVEAYTSQIFEDSRHYLWIATSSGLDMIKLDDYNFNKQPLKLKFNHYVHDNKLNSISSNSIFAICDYHKGNMWFGTDEGIINKLDVANNKFTSYTDKNGLSDLGIRATTIDKYDNIWINTVNGFWKFDTKINVFRKFDESDGLQDVSFSRASFLNKNGKLYVGGINGFNSFYPNEIPFNNAPPRVCITDFKVFNKSVKAGEKIEGNVILNKSINDITELTISYKINFFSFEFSALEFTNPSKNLYSYKMEGFDNQWRNTDSKNRTATYTNLDPGVYNFHVKASNSDGVWNETGTQ